MRRWLRALWSRPRTGPLTVSVPRLDRQDGNCRVSLSVDGRDIWFESRDTELAPSVEAFATAILIPALAAGRPLMIDAPACPVWFDNLRQASALVSQWWNFPTPHLVNSTPVPPSSDPRPSRPGNGVVLCFTGGVDSFYSLLHASPTADVLAFALGYDVDLGDTRLAISAERTVREVARETGKRVVILRTNLRQHRTFRLQSWERTHGCALGAVGHLLNDQIACLQISSSQPYGSTTLWGSRWDLDPLFASSTLAIQHFGAEYLRTEKLWRIAHLPIVQRHLRVCWVRHQGVGNCGRCEKCVRTMLVLETCGQLEHYPSLGRRDQLAERVDAIKHIPWGTIIAYDALLARDLPPHVRLAVERLLERTRASGKVPKVSAAHRTLPTCSA